ncbi:3-phosphoglycerate dehydrogenase [Candidatus Bathyarchaeota archaeon]|nr:MAG: 3-phosphoglycerate dehydrogenase [Candidatus Bathyarchaeota archaeon]
MKILVCDPVHEDGIKILKDAGFRVDVKPNISYEELKQEVANYDVLIVRSRTKVTREIIEAGKNLKVVGRAGAGIDNIDVEAAKEKGVKVLNTPEAPATAVAELTMGLLLSLARQIPKADRTMKEEKWAKKEFKGWQLHDKTLGVIGLGHIGEKVARLAKAFGMKILITKRTPPSPEILKELEAEFVPLEELLRRSDIISLHVPLTPQTYHMIGEKEIQLMKDGAFIINTSRGAIIDEKALLNALKSGKLKGAALDVYETEPPKDYSLVKMPNVICTPHIGAQTVEAQKAASTLLAQKIIDHLKGQQSH